MILSASLLSFVSSYLIALYLQRLKSMTRRRRLAMITLTGAMSGVSIWTVSHLLVASYVPRFPDSLDGVMVAVQIAICVIYYEVLTFTSLSPVRWHHMVGLFLVPFFPALVNFWALTNFAGAEDVDFAVFLKASLWFALAGCAMALLAPKDPGRDVAPALPFATVNTLLVLILHFVMVRAYGLGPDEVRALAVEPSGSFESATLLVPVALANILIILCSSASFFADHEATQEAVRRYRKLALEDRLTGLPNRARMHAQLEKRLAHPDGEGCLVVALIDLDRFKEVNDLHGHAAGDALLVSLAKYLRDRLGPDETLYRLGGDEFVALKTHAESREEGLAFGQFLCDAVLAFETPVTGEIKVGASVGVSVSPEDGTSAAQLLSRADLAMYAAKRSGRNLSLGFTSDMEQETRRKTELSAELDGAVARGELTLCYQPQVDAVSRAVVGFEALLRWTGPRVGEVAPSEFVPIAEESGQIIRIGEWVLREACREAASWDAPHRIAVNVAPGQLIRNEFVPFLAGLLRETGLPAHRLELEVTESGFHRDKDKAIATLVQCRALGVKISMDDFGTGYSSLSMFLECSFDRLKIDASFIRHVTDDENSSFIVRAILALAASNGMSVVAEGVETETQRAFLIREGCDELQGYMFGAATPAEETRQRYGLVTDAAGPALGALG